VAALGPGHFVGELSFLSDHEVSADVIASEETRLMYWKKSELAPLFRRQGLYESYFYSLCSLDVAGKLRAMTASSNPVTAS
jgi:CRP-like cAMP-binding protein